MDGGTEWDAARNWLEMADREDLLELLSYLGVDMGSLPQDQLVQELYWTMESWSTYLTQLYARTGGTWVGPVTLYYFGNGIPSIVAVSTSRHAPSDPMAGLGSLTLLMAVENRAPEALPWQGLREWSTAKAPQGVQGRISVLKAVDL